MVTSSSSHKGNVIYQADIYVVPNVHMISNDDYFQISLVWSIEWHYYRQLITRIIPNVDTAKIRGVDYSEGEVWVVCIEGGGGG